jgi:hypothetical protein
MGVNLCYDEDAINGHSQYTANIDSVSEILMFHHQEARHGGGGIPHGPVKDNSLVLIGTAVGSLTRQAM